MYPGLRYAKKNSKGLCEYEIRFALEKKLEKFWGTFEFFYKFFGIVIRKVDRNCQIGFYDDTTTFFAKRRKNSSKIRLHHLSNPGCPIFMRLLQFLLGFFVILNGCLIRSVNFPSSNFVFNFCEKFVLVFVI